MRAIVVPGGAAITRSQTDLWADFVKKHGLPGVLLLKRANGELTFNVKNGLTPAEMEAFAEALALGDGDLAVLGPAPGDERPGP